MLLQRLPDSQNARAESLDHAEASWHRLQHSADTLTDEELLTLPAEHLLLHLFRTESVRLQPPLDLEFGCSCSRDRTANALRIMGRAEIDEILAQEGRIDITCEFCGETYRYDSVAAMALFQPLVLVKPGNPP